MAVAESYRSAATNTTRAVFSVEIQHEPASISARGLPIMRFSALQRAKPILNPDRQESLTRALGITPLGRRNTKAMDSKILSDRLVTTIRSDRFGKEIGVRVFNDGRSGCEAQA